MAMPLFRAFLNVIALDAEYPLQESWKDVCGIGTRDKSLSNLPRMSIIPLHLDKATTFTTGVDI